MNVAHPAAQRRSVGDVLRLYWAMTRPRVLALVLFTGLPVFAMQQAGWPSLWVTLHVLFGTALAGAACSVLNAYVERDTDAMMARTQKRPLPVASVAPEHALGYGVFLTLASTASLWLSGGLVAAAVGLGSILFYVFVYTMWLKPRTPQNIVIGGAAGATTPLIADAAMNGSIGLGSTMLFLIIFFWTPPHFWAIALFRKDDYAAAGIPMMPNVVGDQPTRWRMLAYTLLLVPITMAPVAIDYMGWFYGASALLLGAWFTWKNIGVLRAQDVRQDRKFFMVSNVYLLALFGAMIVDVVVV
ncbi:MAG: protoheme IX farnesyltransferase [Proteobacteria bacterium]|nr:protoheme IX farnesyltransferase [Pseudomonadota bacterium]MCP4917972.1 protoheme IX farnesyltransferase [Pseudomonadota bacterium]